MKKKLKKIFAQVNLGPKIKLVYLALVGGTALFILGGIGAFMVKQQLSSSNSHQISTTTPTPTPTPIPAEAFLLLGYGGGNHDGGKLTDTMIEIYVQPEKKQVTLISIPRDLWVKIPGTEEFAKINYAYAAKGLKGAKQAVTEVTGIKPSYAAAIDFAGFIKLLKEFEPIKVQVPYSFTDYFYPIEGKEKDTCGLSEAEVAALTQKYSDFELEKQFPCRYETISFSAGETQMTAEEALKFVRSRHGNDGKGDFGRSQRQQALIIALKNKLLSPDMWIKLPGLTKEALKLIDTDINSEAILSYIKLARNLGDVARWRFNTIVLDDTNVLINDRARNGAFILKPRSNPSANLELKKLLSDSQVQPSLKSQANKDPFFEIKEFIHLNLAIFDLPREASVSAQNKP